MRSPTRSDPFGDGTFESRTAAATIATRNSTGRGVLPVAPSVLRSYRDRMATAADYRAASGAVGGAVESISGMVRDLDGFGNDLGFSGTPVADSLRSGLIAASTNAADAASACDQLIAELQRRARFCDEYTQAMASYRRRLSSWQTWYGHWLAAINDGQPASWPGPMPTPPVRPFPEAEEG